MTKKEGIALKVSEIHQRDVGYSRAKVDRKIMKELGLKSGDTIVIKGRKTTGAIVMPSDAFDEGRGIIRIDNLTRKNAWVKIGDQVKIEKQPTPEAMKVVIDPVRDEDRVRFERKHIEEIVRQYLLGRPVLEWDSVAVPTSEDKYRGLVLSFVVKTIPSQCIVTISEETRFVFNGNRMTKVDSIVKGLKHGTVIPHFCEPLKDMRFNLQYCPYREDCIWLDEFFESPYPVFEQYNTMEDMIRCLHCDFCKSDSWVFVGTTLSGRMLKVPLTPTWGRRIRKLIT